MIENEKAIAVDFGSVKTEIVTRVSNEGPMGDMESWRKAFPDIDFIEEDVVYSGKDVDWEDRTVEERAFYVAFMKNPLAARVNLEMQLEGLKFAESVDDAEVIWRLWEGGCFSGEELSEEAIKTILWYTCDFEKTKQHVFDLDLEKVSIPKLEAMVAPVFGTERLVV